MNDTLTIMGVLLDVLADLLVMVGIVIAALTGLLVLVWVDLRRLPACNWRQRDRGN